MQIKLKNRCNFKNLFMVYLVLPRDFIVVFIFIVFLLSQYLMNIIRICPVDLAVDFFVNDSVHNRVATILTPVFWFQNFFFNEVQYNIGNQ